MRIIVSVFVYAFIIIFANTSYTETNEIKKFYFSEDPIPINNLKVLDIDSDETNILNKNYNLSLNSALQTSQNYIQRTLPNDDLSYKTSLSTNFKIPMGLHCTTVPICIGS